MKRDRIDIVLRLAYLEGKISTRGLIEKTVLRRVPVVKMSDEATMRLCSRLEIALAERRAEDAMKGALTLGEYISNEVKNVSAGKRGVLFASLSKITGCTAAQLAGLCREEVSPAAIPANAMNALLRHFAIPKAAAMTLLRNSIRCVAMGPSLASALARYDGRKGGRKSQTMRKAVRELFVKAEISLTPKEKEDNDDYVERATADLDA